MALPISVLLSAWHYCWFFSILLCLIPAMENEMLTFDMVLCNTIDYRNLSDYSEKKRSDNEKPLYYCILYWWREVSIWSWWLLYSDHVVFIVAVILLFHLANEKPVIRTFCCMPSRRKATVIHTIRRKADYSKKKICCSTILTKMKRRRKLNISITYVHLTVVISLWKQLTSSHFILWPVQYVAEKFYPGDPVTVWQYYWRAEERKWHWYSYW